MKTVHRSLFKLLSILFYIQNIYAAIPNTDHPITFLGPTLRGGFTGLLTDTSGYSFAGEAGINNLRISGSVGWDLFDVHRLKLTGEYMGQRIDYAFFNRTRDIVVNQGAVGMDYEFDINPFTRWRPQFDLSAYYENTPTSPLDTESGTFITSTGVLQTYTDTQRLAGSNAAGISPGFSIYPWPGGKAGIELNYDNVRYDMKYQSNVEAEGWGGTVRLRQLFPHRITGDLSAAVRKPFNNYEAAISWATPPCDGAWEFKLFGVYTIGKQSLPNTYNIGLSADYFMDRKEETTLTELMKQGFLNWMATPAVHMPEALTITDEKIDE